MWGMRKNGTLLNIRWMVLLLSKLGEVAKGTGSAYRVAFWTGEVCDAY